MSDSDRNELRDLRTLLQGALADKAVLVDRLTQATELRIALEQRLERQTAELRHVTAERDRLREEKARFNHWLIEDDS